MLLGTKEAALNNADALVVCTEWQSFKAPDFDVIKLSLHQAVLLDGRNLFEPKRMAKRQFKYYSIGRSV